MNATKNAGLFTELTTEESATLQGGCRWHSSYRPYYYYRPNTYSYTPRYNYGYGYGGYSSGSVSQTTNVNVVYDD